MRLSARVMVVVALAVSVGACGGETAAPKAGGSDHTTEVCADALAENAKAADDYSEILFDALAQAGDPVKGNEYQDKLHRRLAEWQAKLNEWSAKAIKAEVRDVLVDGANMVGRLNEPGGTHIGLAKVQEQFAEFTKTLAAACGS